MIKRRKKICFLQLRYLFVSLFFFLLLKYDVFYFKSRKCRKVQSKQTDVTSCSSAVICNLPATCSYDYNNLRTVYYKIFTRLFQYFLNRYITQLILFTQYSIFEKKHMDTQLIRFCIMLNLFLQIATDGIKNLEVEKYTGRSWTMQ